MVRVLVRLNARQAFRIMYVRGLNLEGNGTRGSDGKGAITAAPAERLREEGSLGAKGVNEG